LSRNITSEQPLDKGASRQKSRWKVWWTLLLMLPVALAFTAADRSADAVPCLALDIEVDQMEGMFFVDAPTLHALVTERFNLIERPMSSLPLGALHRTISEQNGVASCRIEPTLGGALKVQVTQQRPLARVWMPDTVLYLDEMGGTLALSGRYTADVPVLHAPTMAAAQSTLPLLRMMDTSPFWDQLIDQIEVQESGAVSFRPRIGDVVVELGPAAQLEQDLNGRLDRLLNFYKALIQRGDLRQYRKISLQYDGQLVASK